MKLKSGIQHISLDEGSVVFDSSSGNTHVFDSCGEDILKLCDGSNTVETIIEKISEMYDAASSEIEQDVKDFICQLKEKGLLAEG